MKNVLFLLFAVHAASANAVIDSESFQRKTVPVSEGDLEYVESSTGGQIEDLIRQDENHQIKWKKPQKLNFGYGASPKWFRMQINNRHPSFVVNYLYPMMQVVRMYVVQNHRVAGSAFGGKRLHNELYRGVLLRSDLQGEQTVFLYLESTGGFQVPLFIGTPENIQYGITIEYLLLGAWLGIILSLVIYYLIIFVKL